jgi:hypothetical protein
VTTVTTPWGATERLEAVTVPQRAGDRRFAAVVELLETRSGERLVRFSYATEGTVRRGPVALRERDIERLRRALDRTPVLREVLTPMW